MGTLLVVRAVEGVGTDLGLAALVGGSLFLAIVAAFVTVPHVMVAITIPFFIFLPTLKVFVAEVLGGAKDVITLAALAAAAILFVQRRASREAWAVDRAVIMLVGLIFALYVANVGGNLAESSTYGIAWFHGVRLFAEPLSLLLVGLSLREPERCLRFATYSLVVTGFVVVAVGLAQQVLGVQRLLNLGYTYGREVRQIGPHLRSFGTLPEPFSYASLLLLVLTVLLLAARPRPGVIVASAAIAAGVAASYVRTAALVALALFGLALARRGHVRFAVLLLLAAVVAAGTIFVDAMDTTSRRSVRVSPTLYLTLNGRTSLWRETLGESRAGWVFGQGVGKHGTASQRAAETLTGARNVRSSASAGTIVDSGYLVVVSDIGLIGLALVLGLLGRLFVLARRAAASGEQSGWMVLGVLTVISLDALTRESLTGFPTAYVGMLIVGLACATWQARRVGARPR